MSECSKCGKEIGEGEEGRPMATMSGGIMGDEYTESWYFCPDCQVYTVGVYHDRFSGEDDFKIQGPVDRTTGDARVAIIKRCSRAWDKRCRCSAHREYFGNWLD